MKYRARDKVVGFGLEVSGGASKSLLAYGERLSISAIGLDGIGEREAEDREGRGDELPEP